MDNHELTEMWAYHDGTKHSVESVYRSGHRLEWAIMPRPFKVYPDLLPCQCVQGTKRLIHEQQQWIVDQCPADRSTLLHSAR